MRWVVRGLQRRPWRTGRRDRRRRRGRRARAAERPRWCRPTGRSRGRCRLDGSTTIGPRGRVRAPARGHLRLAAARADLRPRRQLVRRGPRLDQRHLRERTEARRARRCSRPATRSGSARRSWSSADEDRRRRRHRRGPRPRRQRGRLHRRSRRSTPSPTGWAARGRARSRRSSRSQTIAEMQRGRHRHARGRGARGEPDRVRARRRGRRALRGDGHDRSPPRSPAPRRCTSRTSATAAPTCARAGSLRQLTRDHTLVDRMVQAGEISRDEADVHPHRNVLLRALGTEPKVDVDADDLGLLEGDRVLLCSDGLTDDGHRGPDPGDPGAIAPGEPQDAADRLVRAANRAGGIDNITAIVLDVQRRRARRGHGCAERPPRPSRRRRRVAVVALDRRRARDDRPVDRSPTPCSGPTSTSSGTSA